MNRPSSCSPGRGDGPGRYALVSPCRNEQEHIRTTIESVLKQSVLPSRWVIVDDGSTDRTPQILDEYSQAHDWIQVVRRPDRGRRQVGPGVVEAFNAGYEMLADTPHDYLCKLDLDLDLPAEYFHGLMQKMQADPRLGTCSGKPYVRHADGRLEAEPSGDEMSVGMTKFYRRECFEQIGGFVPQVMWDGIDCHRCRMLGWRAASFDDPSLRFIHLRPMGSSQRGILTGRMRHGYGQYFMGTSPAYIVASGLYRALRWPFFIGGAAMVWGYLLSALRRKPRYDDPAFRKFLRRYQRFCLIKGKAEATARIERERASVWRSGEAENKQQTVSSADWPEKTVELFGVRFASVTEKQVIEHIIDHDSGGWVITPNLDILKKIVQTDEGRRVSSKASFLVADGAPLVWASRLKKQPLPERVAGSTLLVSLSEAAAAAGRSIYLLGGAPSTAERAAETLCGRFENLKIAGVDCPPMGFEQDPEQLAAIRRRLLEARPDIVFVGLGFPKQERIIERFREDLPETWWLGVGVSFSFVSGQIRRAPLWMQRAGLEWVHRLAQEPLRLARRYLIDDIPFGIKLLGSSLLQRFRMPCR